MIECVLQYYDEEGEFGQSSLIQSMFHLVHVVLYRFRVAHVPTDQVVVINAGTSPQEVLLPRGAYDVETIIAMLNASDAFIFRIGGL